MRWRNSRGRAKNLLKVSRAITIGLGVFVEGVFDRGVSGGRVSRSWMRRYVLLRIRARGRLWKLRIDMMGKGDLLQVA